MISQQPFSEIFQNYSDSDLYYNTRHVISRSSVVKFTNCYTPFTLLYLQGKHTNSQHYK